MPCILVTFDKEQIVVWRGEDYKPLEEGQFPLDDRWESKNDSNGWDEEEVVSSSSDDE